VRNIFIKQSKNGTVWHVGREEIQESPKIKPREAKHGKTPRSAKKPKPKNPNTNNTADFRKKGFEARRGRR